MDTDHWQQRIRVFADERDWHKFHNPKNIAMALSVEASELLEIFQWLTPEQSASVMEGEHAASVRDEIADVLTYTLRLADVLEIDLDAALTDKAARNALRYPVELSRGSAAKAPGAVAQVAPVEVAHPVLGIDGCRGGWIGALIVPNQTQPRLVFAPSVAELVDGVRAQHDVAVVGVDIPIGLPADAAREADRLARRALGRRGSSVFTTATRAAYGQATREAADAVNRSRAGSGVSAQAFALRARILEVDGWVRSEPGVTVVEVHPELSFATMTGSPMEHRKTTRAGHAERLAALTTAGLQGPSQLTGPGYAADDALDACAVAWSVARVAASVAISLPEVPQPMTKGMTAAIHA